VAWGVEDRLAIHELVALHGHLVDAGQLREKDLARLFTPDVRYDVTALGGAVLVGLAAIRDASLELGSNNPVAHLVTNVVVHPHPDGETATVWSKGLGVTQDGRVGSVTYHDVVTRTNDGWRIRARQVTPRREPLTP
jgi:SnoaL-like domain